MEQKHKKSRSANLINTLKAARRELDSLLSDKVEGTFTNQKYYDHGNRASIFRRVFRLRKLQSSNTIQRIKSQDLFVTKPDKIEFYKPLYKNTDTCVDDGKLTEFLSHIKLSELTDLAVKGSDEPIKEQEIKQVISTLKRAQGQMDTLTNFMKHFKICCKNDVLEHAHSCSLGSCTGRSVCSMYRPHEPRDISCTLPASILQPFSLLA